MPVIIPVLFHIPPPDIRPTKATAKFICSVQAKPQLPVYSDILQFPPVPTGQ